MLVNEEAQVYQGTCAVSLLVLLIFVLRLQCLPNIISKSEYMDAINISSGEKQQGDDY